MIESDLRSFVKGYFSLMKAEAREDPPGVLNYDIPPESRAAVNAASLRLTFDPEMAERLDGVDLVVPGSALLDKIIEDAGGRGLHCCASVDTVESRPVDDVITKSLRFVNASTEVIEARRKVVPHGLFAFKVTITTDERTELLELVLVNQETLNEHPVDGMYLGESLPIPANLHTLGSGVNGSYHAACDRLEERMGRVIAPYREKARKRLVEEEGRIDDYYTQFIKEVKETKYPSQAANIIRALQLEREKRIYEARLRFSLDAKARLVNVRTILIPTVQVTARVSGRIRSREIGLEYDEVSLKMIGVSCESCGSGTDEFLFCDEGHVSCRDCSLSCAFCESILCRSCTGADGEQGKCADCGRPLCPEHSLRDEYGLRTYCRDHVTECPVCCKLASGSFTNHCRNCSQRYCFLCVSARDGLCKTCRSLKRTTGDDVDVKKVEAQSVFAGKLGKWRKGRNSRFTVIEGRALLLRRTFVLDDQGNLLWEG